MEKFFANKRILFIAPHFFRYEQEIKKRLESLGAHVDFYDDRPSNSALTKIVIRLMPIFQRKRIRDYFSTIVENSTNDYDFIFIIKMECMPLDILRELRRKNTRAKFIYYSWDSLRNNSNIKEAIEIFDAAFTFDNNDADNIKGFKLRPLFFLNEYRELASGVTQYNVSFIGTAHSDRYLLVKKIKAIFPKNDLPNFFFLYVPHPIIFFVKKIFVPAFFSSKKSEFSFYSLDKEKILHIISRSNAVLDFQHPNQSGLTMRTIEMVGAKKKMVTTNLNVKKYDFYRSENIAVIDRDNPLISEDFFNSPYVELPKELYDRYSIDGWLKEIFSVPGEAVM